MEVYAYVLVLLAVVGGIVAVLLRVFRAPPRRPGSQIRTMVVLGSGGHTSEMLNLLDTLDLSTYRPRCYVIAESDRGVQGSANKANAFEIEHGFIDALSNSVRVIPRSREVGQSYLSSIGTTIISLAASIALVWREKPDLVLCNGPGTCLPIAYAAWMMRFMRLKDCKIVFSESLACVHHISLTASLLRPICDLMCVQWEELQKAVKGSVCTGRLFTPIRDGKQPSEGDYQDGRKGLVVVTVGSTSFDELIESVDTIEFVELVRNLGYSGLRVQYGRGMYRPQLIGKENSSEGFKLEALDYADSLRTIIQGAAVVISHAGAGSIVETLNAGKRLIVVPNEKLMNNHQLQLAFELEERGYLHSARVETLREVLVKSFSAKRVPFPPRESTAFEDHVKAILPK